MDAQSNPQLPLKPGAVQHRACFVLASLSAIALAGCKVGGKDFDNENDRLRRELSESQTQIKRLTAERAELSAKLSEALRSRDAATGPSADVVAAMPRCAGITLGNRSGFVDADGAPGPESVELILEPFDSRHRFVQIAGSVMCDVTELPSASGAPPRLLGSISLSPEQLREAYRSSFMGTHYTVSVPLSDGLSVRPAASIARVLFHDGITGVSHEATMTLR